MKDFVADGGEEPTAMFRATERPEEENLRGSTVGHFRSEKSCPAATGIRIKV